MTNKIQLRRDTTANWTRVNPILDDGEPGLDITLNQIKYGDGSTAWNDLSYASGGLTDVDGVVTFPGNLLIGTLWPEDPLPMGDKESVVWAKDDTEYLGLWWGGNQTYPNPQYGPIAGIQIGTGNTDDFTGDPSPADTKIIIGINDSNGDTLEWRFDRDGMLTLPQGSTINEIPAAETVTLDQLTDISSWTGTLVFTKNGATYQALPNGPMIRYVGSNWLIQYALTSWFSSTDLITWTVGPYEGTTPPVGTLSIATTNLTVGTDTWTFGANGNLTFPTGGHIGPGGGKGEGTTLGGANNHFVSLTSYYDSGLYSSCVTAYADGTLNITAYNDGGENPAKIWTFANDGILKMPPGNETTAGWIQWSHAADDLTNVAGAGFVDFYNVYTGLGLSVPRDTNINKGIWFGTPLNQTNPFLPETSMVFKGDTLYIPKNGYIKSHDIAVNNSSPNLTSRNTTVTIQTDSEYNITQIQNPGSGYGSQSNVTTSGGNGSNMTVNIDVLDGYVRIVEVNQPGTGYNNGDIITIAGGDGTATFTIDNYSSTKVNGTYNWTFGTDGKLTVPGEIHSAVGSGDVNIQSNDGNNTYTWTFGATGVLTLPGAVSGPSGDNNVYIATTGGKQWTFNAVGAFNFPSFGSTPNDVTDGSVGDLARTGDVLYFKTSTGWKTVTLT